MQNVQCFVKSAAAHSKTMKHSFPGATRALVAPLSLLAAALLAAQPVAAQSAANRPVTPTQRATAQ